MDEYSFATKYCYFCELCDETAEKDRFPIVDSYSKNVLYYLNQYLENEGAAFHTSIKRDDLEDYEKYCEIYSSFKNYLTPSDGVSRISNKEIDKFLWHYGKYPYFDKQ